MYVWVLERHFSGNFERLGIFESRENARNYVNRVFCSTLSWCDLPRMSSSSDYLRENDDERMTFFIERELVI